MPTSNIRSNDLFVPRTILIALAVLCALGLTLAGAPAAHATPYIGIASFGGKGVEGIRYGVAIDPASGDIYVTNRACTRHCLVDKFEGGTYELLSQFGSGAEETKGASGVAVNPTNRNVYVVDSRDYTIQTWSASAGEASTPLESFSVADARTFLDGFFGGLLTQIASDASGDIYFPNAAQHTVQVFSPTGTVEQTIEGAEVGAFTEPRGVALDSQGNLYVADDSSGEGARVVRIEHGTGAQTELVPKSVGATGVSVAVDTSNNNVFVGMYSEDAACESLGSSCFHVVEYGPTGTEIEGFGAGVIKDSVSLAEIGRVDQLTVDPATHDVYVAPSDEQEEAVLVFGQKVLPKVAYPTPSVTGLTATGATLHGEVNPQGNETSCRFEYGTSTTYEHSVPCQPKLVGEGSKFKPEAVTISSLEGNTEYHFRLVAETGAGEAIRGADETFTTLPAPPAVLASSVLASNVTQTDAVFNATINPQHLDTHYWFNYSRYPFEDASGCTPTAPYASAPATPVDMGAGTGPEAVELDLAGADVVLHPGMGSRELQPNTVYRFQVVADNSSGTTCEPEATFITLPPDPLAGTGAASAITQIAATLSGTVTPGSTGPNSDTTWYFQYGTSTAYGLFGPATVNQGTYQAAPQDAGMGASPVAVSTALVGLAPNTTYHYRLRASNANADPAADPAAAPQIAHGADHTFTTPPSEPLLDEPSGLTETGVTLNGAADPGGHALRYSFQYGTSADYGQSSPTEDAGEGATFTPVSATLTGLAPGVTYHYRLAVTGGGGSSYSQDSTFTLYTPAPAQAGNPFAPGQSTPAPFPMLALLSTPAFPAQPSGASPPPLTNAQKLARALRACRKDKAKSRRRRCEKAARKRYGTVARKTSGKS